MTQIITPPTGQKQGLTFDRIEDAEARLMDINAANGVGLCLLEMLEIVAKATEILDNKKIDLVTVRKQLLKNDQVLDIFFIVNMILKGILTMMDGEDWIKTVEKEDHLYPQSAINFLKRVYETDFSDTIEYDQESPITIIK